MKTKTKHTPPPDQSLLEMLKKIKEAEFGYGEWPSEEEIEKVIAQAQERP